ncbi:hypothetical protein [Paenibacillus montanisoli]|uniref:Uncharacterized protein n=1 Tax=Paenibacillus montanisoli TaxID=2081970 RepID=A0A328TZD1_9BACL|nr:hypothetical protein [Paenibacillus montanisoli]RAP75888.1 hypothetical protein DL346_10680 [Paenibacillus montanisoli]
MKKSKIAVTAMLGASLLFGALASPAFAAKPEAKPEGTRVIVYAKPEAKPEATKTKSSIAGAKAEAKPEV